MAKFHLPSLEEERLKIWKDKDIFRKALAKPAPRGDFKFFEGPPTANGKPGIHHVLARSFKDVILRFRTMQGWHIDRKAGWDTHGLPVELEVEKQLGFTRKQQIEDYGIAKFNAKCKESVWKYLDLWEKMTERIGFWVDLKDPYITYQNDYIESLWWILNEIEKKGLLYQGCRVTPHCPRCVTSLSSHELAQGYKDIDDQSVYIKFAVAGADEKYFLVWTTTPWTLPGNTALAVGADVTYVEARLKATGETFILAKALLGKLDGEYEIVSETTGAKLAGTSYKPLYDVDKEYLLSFIDAAWLTNAYKVYTADFVSITDGTGIVHIAPAFGEDDYRLGDTAKLPALLTVDDTGKVLPNVPGKGKFIKKADEDIKADLAARGLLYKSETYRHAYPFCWRCGTPLLYVAKVSWFIGMSELSERLQKNNEQINWVPDHIKEGRFGEWLREVKDWALSRERYWGTPLPIWRCERGHREVAGGFDDLKRLGRPVNRYFLQRHGEAENNVQNIVSSWPEQKEWHLTAKGREQVQASARLLKKKKIDLIFASDLLRTKETAEIIAQELGLPIEYEPRLREVALGLLNGRTIEEFRAQFKNRADRFQKQELGESLHDCRRRMVGFVKELEAKYEGKNILIVSHGDPLWMLRTGFAGLTDEATLDTTYNHVGDVLEMELERLPHDDEGRVDPHRPFVDEVVLRCPKCAGAMKRVTDVIDCWFDSGAMPFAQWHYPFADKDRIDSGRNFPADYISEAIDQTRGWFYTLLAISTLLGHDKPPYLNCICLGHVLDNKGQKMSKSKGNVVDPWAMIAKYGADAIRYHFFTVNQPGDPKLFDEKSLDEVTKKVFLIIWNVLTFWKMYAGSFVASSVAPTSDSMLDRWIMAKLNGLTAAVTRDMESYDVVGACRSLGEFVTDLSTWYLRRSRDRFKSDAVGEKAAAVGTLGHVLLTLSKLFAPFTPFLADALYAEVGGTKESVHLDEWPAAGAADQIPANVGSDNESARPKVWVSAETVDQALIDRMDLVRKAAAAGLWKRVTAGIPVRQVLAKVIIHSGQVFEPWMNTIVAEELNVESAETSVTNDIKDIIGIELDTNITPELKRKGAARELVRQINDLRKAAGLTIQDRIIVNWDSASDFWKQVVSERGAEVAASVLADKLEVGRIESKDSKEIAADGAKIWLGIRKS